MKKQVLIFGILFSVAVLFAKTNEPIEKMSESRSQICLNGVWGFVPAFESAKGDEKAASSEWGTIRVPGSWYNRAWEHRPSVVMRGEGEVWNYFDQVKAKWYKSDSPYKESKGFYERDIAIPEEWKDKKILLKLDRVSAKASIYVDGKFLGVIGCSGGTVDLTDHVKPGEVSRLRIFVRAGNETMESHEYAGEKKGKAKPLRIFGIIGDTFIQALPKGTLIEDVFIETSVKNKKLTCDLELSGIDPNSPLSIELKVIDVDNKVIKELRTEQPELKNKKEGRFSISIPWDDARLWSPDDPYLHTAVIKVNNGASKDEVRRKFGFREFKIEGKDFFLNGTKIRLRPFCYNTNFIYNEPAAIENAVKSVKSSGFNIWELWPRDRYTVGNAFFDELWMEAADRHGILLIAPVANFKKMLGKWDAPETRELWRKRVKKDIARHGHHASIVMWTGTPNTFTFFGDQDPSVIGNSKLAVPKGTDYLEKKRKASEALAMLKEIDSSRPAFWHAGVTCGDVYTLNNYLDFIPLQEREEWLSEWVKKGDMPLMMIEFGSPLGYSFRRGRICFQQAAFSEPLLTEFSAAYLGSTSYAMESELYRKKIKRHFISDQKYKPFSPNIIRMGKNCQALLSEFITKTWRSWRTWGISGGMAPWDLAGIWHRPGVGGNYKEVKLAPFYPGKRGFHNDTFKKSYLHQLGDNGIKRYGAWDALKSAISETMAWIAGPKGAFTDKTHNFKPGQKVEKQVVLINDALKKLKYQGNWKVLLSGKILAEGELKGELAPAEILKLPVNFKIPVTNAPKVDGEIKLEVTIGEKKHQDSFKLRIFQSPKIVEKSLAIFDPEGDTSEFLKEMGYELKKWDGGETKDVLVIGRNALASGKPLPGNLDNFVRNGGKAVIFAHKPDFLRRQKKYRISRFVSRRLFPVDSRHPALIGLDATDFSDWAGRSSLGAETLTNPKILRHRLPYGWHWGNRGGVATSAIEKPHKSGWRPILECEFDLAYSPLMELDLGKGKLVLDMLDVEKRGADEPVTKIVTKNIIDYLEKCETVPRKPVFLADSGVEGKKLLDLLELPFEKTSAIPENPASVLVIGEAPEISLKQLEDYAGKGGYVLILPRTSSSKENYGVSLLEKKRPGSLAVPTWPECRGLSASDLRWRVSMPAMLISKGAKIGANGLLARKKIGKGVIIWSQTAPYLFDADTKTYLRYTRWRQTRAIAQILANMGASFKLDANFLRSSDSAIPLDGEWKFKISKEFPFGNGKSRPDPGISQEAQKLLDSSEENNWERINMPSMIKRFNTVEGEAVLRKRITIPESWAGKELVLSLGPIDDFDSTFFNGQKVGQTDKSTPKFWKTPRRYKIPGNLVKPGEAVISIRIFDHLHAGGLKGEIEELYISPTEFITRAPYSEDYIEGHALGDDPFRYNRW